MSKVLQALFILKCISLSSLSFAEGPCISENEPDCSLQSAQLVNLQFLVMRPISDFDLHTLCNETKGGSDVPKQAHELTERQRQRIEQKIHFYGGHLFPKDAPEVRDLYAQLELNQQRIEAALQVSSNPYAVLDRDYWNVLEQIQHTPISVQQVLNLYHAQNKKEF